MKNWFRRSIKNQLILFILIVVLVPICVLGLVSYYTTVKVSKERAAISGESSLEQIQDSIEFIVNDVENMSVFLIGNQAVQAYLQVEGDPIYPQRDIYGFLSNLAFSKRYINDIIIYPINGNSPISTNLVMDTNAAIDIKQIPNGKWWSYRKVNKTVDGNKDMITLTRPIRSTGDFERIGYLSISLNQRVVEEYLSSGDSEWSTSVFILNDGNVLAHSQTNIKEKINLDKLTLLLDQNNKERFSFLAEEEEVTVFTEEIGKVGWHIISLVPSREYSSQNRYFLWLTIYSVVIAILLVAGLVIFFVSKVFKPLTTLTNSIQTVNPGETIKTINNDANNEIGELIGSYNQLNQRIAKLMNQVQKSEALKRELDMKALQSQVNPHFLYNTLAAIHWIALSSKAHDISKMVSSLSTLLRFSLNKGNEYCTVEQEIGHLLHYIEIKKIRFPNRFSIDLEISNDLKQHKMLKLVLQPLIENSIKHGFFPLPNHFGKISVHVQIQGNFIHFSIIDNGAGITSAKLQEIKHQFLHDQETEALIGTNYGIRNVNLRLLLHYGKESGLRIDSKEMQGTIVEFVIPIKEGGML
ncbi:MAG: cache domain-containing sensor histidine kinase [Bacillota bacterium]|uniref:histidine kinase n=1 Tax=Virgibacillus salarius TaxID=447199 RepID=A0A941DY30_9BACI|nr:sensor histidine kinase [Virgibacillus salarius]MBR7797677.1 sensor histidine kinase [Virgibacillus salarius]NAZ10387.1 sensor histidine kinase [Agaribacter marinus]WBX78660.1 sensor histidine kinase [Virgibacillus salarius]